MALAFRVPKKCKGGSKKRAMNAYHVRTEHYRELLRDCRAELLLLGYTAATARLPGAAEFLQRMERAGKTALDLIDKRDIEAHVAHLYTRPGHNRDGGALSGYTVLSYIFSLRLLFDYAERHGRIPGGSPLAGLRFSRPRQTQRYCATRKEITKLYAACSDDRQRAILHLLYGCGLRRSEAEALNVRDIDHVAGLLYVRRGKGRKRRVVPLSERVNEGLKQYRLRERWQWITDQRGRTPAFLLNDRGGRMLGNTIGRRLTELVRAAGVDRRITPHGLRHAIATHLLNGGMPVERVRDFLGHELLETTQLYTRVSPKQAE